MFSHLGRDVSFGPLRHLSEHHPHLLELQETLADIAAEWAKIVDENPDLLELSPNPQPNNAAIRQHPTFGKLFTESYIPDHVEGFNCEDLDQMKISWPEGIDKARLVCPSNCRFLLPLHN